MDSSNATQIHTGHGTIPRNPGTDFDLDWALSLTANTSAIERRCATLPGRRSVKKDLSGRVALEGDQPD